MTEGNIKIEEKYADLGEYIRLREKYREGFKIHGCSVFTTNGAEEARILLTQARAVAILMEHYISATAEDVIDELNPRIMARVTDCITTLIEHSLYELDLEDSIWRVRHQ